MLSSEYAVDPFLAPRSARGSARGSFSSPRLGLLLYKGEGAEKEEAGGVPSFRKVTPRDLIYC